MTFSWKPSWRHCSTALLATASVFVSTAGLTGVDSVLADTPINNTANVTFNNPNNTAAPFTTVSNTVTATSPLVDPLGQVLSCNGTTLADYTGFSVALYEADDSGLGLGNLLALTETELPDVANNGVASGRAPNIANVNPFGLSNASDGRYNFLFDPTRALQSPINVGLTQTSVGAQYILVVAPPVGTGLTERRIKIELLPPTATNTVRYQATSLDGIAISTAGGSQITDQVVEISNAETQGLNLFALALTTQLCESSQIEITKTADRAAAQPGDTVVYRLLIRNLVATNLDTVVASDILPAGFQLLPESATALIANQPVPLTVELNGSTVTFSANRELPANESMEIIYAARLTPDAVRGTGENTAVVNGRRVDNGFSVQDGPSIHRVVVDPGLLADCGTLIGRVFVDKNFDGEQQAGEAGIPNAVIFLEDGNRIVTDSDGLYSVACLLPGHHTGVLDLTSLPGYTLAPNLYFAERNSQSRLVHLAPGGMVRLNFGVTPAFQAVD